MRHIIGILLQNESGALSRVAGLFSSRGYNIESLSVSATDDPTLSRLTLVTQGSDAVVQQIVNQLHKLIDVVAVNDMTGEDHVESELALLKVRVKPAARDKVKERVQVAGGRVVVEERDYLIAEITSSEAAINELAKELATQGELLEIVRSGALAMSRQDPWQSPGPRRNHFRTYSAELSVSPVRIRMTRSISVMKILPSPTLPVLAALRMASMTWSTSSLRTATSMRVLGTKSTTYSAPRYSSVWPRWRPKPFTSVTVMPETPISDNAARTSSSLKGLIIAVTSFMRDSRLRYSQSRPERSRDWGTDCTFRATAIVAPNRGARSLLAPRCPPELHQFRAAR
jgi:acetolactate synthase-1/3 small subunit